MTGQANFLQSLGWAVLNSLWQMALLWVVYQLITALFKTARPAAKSTLAAALLIGGFGWFLYTFIAACIGSVPGQAVFSSAFINPANDQLTDNWLQKVLPLASMAYLLLLIFPLLRFIKNYRYVQVIRKYGLTRMQADWRLFVNKVAGQMGIRKKVQIWVSRFVSSPVTIGFIKPVILIPLAALNNLSPQQLEAVLLHELSHIRRHDYLVNLVINFIRAILYFNPFVKAFIKIVEKEREKSCDEMVLQFQYDSHEYASALLLLEKGNEKLSHFTIGAAGRQQDLLGRIELILGIRKKNSFSFTKVKALFAGLFCIITLNALLSKNDSPGSFNAASVAAIAPAGFPSIYDKSVIPAASEYTATHPIRNTAKHTEVKSLPEAILPASYTYSPAPRPEMIQANYEPVQVPELKKYQEEQVKEALQASKKVLESIQWKVIEKSIADVFTQQEKDEIRSDYEKELNNFDWKKWENNLRVAYDRVDWEKVNSQLNYAIAQVRMDSLQRVYNSNMIRLSEAEKQLSVQKLNGIPDSDITLRVIEDKKRQAQRALNTLRAVRNKKIVHL
jgi:beta-lactamase regulating signal transducer with metallopeptidase domain